MLTTTITTDRPGNTIPYAPISDDVRKNHGYMDTRGRPDVAATIPETRESTALRELVMAVAAPTARYFSVGCDLGTHRDPHASAAQHQVAGGYIQLISRNYDEVTDEILELANLLEENVEPNSTAYQWELRFDFTGVIFNDVHAFSLWIWFFAAAETPETASLSREELIGRIHGALVPAL